jgi:N4-gp56 family major capsid protein
MTQVTSAMSNKIMQAALFTEANRSKSFANMLTDSAPQEAQPDNAKNQTSHTAPIVRVLDLEKQAGDEVSMQVFHQLNGRPTMGDKKIAGRLENLSQADFSLKIQQARHGVDAGGKMSQQRTKHNLKKTARTLLTGAYYNKLGDQMTTVHLAGARGSVTGGDIIVPLSSDDEFAEIMVNDVLPPTYERHSFGGDATSLAGIDSSDLFSLPSVDNLSLILSELANPLSPVKFSQDGMADEDPWYVLNVTPRQWNDWYTSTSGKDWQSMMASAMNRSKGFDHPLFKGQCAMWRNILVRQYGGMPIRFYTGDTVTVSNNDNAATTTQVTAGTNIDRAILLGGQAMALAFGAQNGGSFNYHEEPTDHGNSTEISISWINGMKKIRFANKYGKVNDLGVMVLDTAVKLS